MCFIQSVNAMLSNHSEMKFFGEYVGNPWHFSLKWTQNWTQRDETSTGMAVGPTRRRPMSCSAEDTKVETSELGVTWEVLGLEIKTYQIEIQEKTTKTEKQN